MTNSDSEAIACFNRLMGECPDLSGISTAHISEDCGIYSQRGGDFADVKCLAVAWTKNESWIVLLPDGTLDLFEPHEVV